MLNLAWSLVAAVLVAVIFVLLQVHVAISVPLGLVVGVVVFIFLGRRIQDRLETIMTAMQKEVANQKLDRAIAVLKKGFAFKKHHFFVEAQLNSQIGMLHYLKKENDKAAEYLNKGFVKHYVGQCMLATIHYKKKEYEKMHKVMEETIKSNKKESFCYALYAYFLSQLKEREKAIEVIQRGLKVLPDDERLTANIILLQNQKKMKMKVYGDVWVQFMLERPPRVTQAHPFQGKHSKRAIFR